jgi:hypothetical protein
VVFCSGVLYHTPDPFHLISRLRLVCGHTLILHTAIIPEMNGIQNAAVYYPFLTDSQRKMWDLGVGKQLGISTPYEQESGYGNWFWGMSPSCIESLLTCAGFKIAERHIGAFSGCFVCTVDSELFTPVSGDWTELPDKDFLKVKY